MRFDVFIQFGARPGGRRLLRILTCSRRPRTPTQIEYPPFLAGDLHRLPASGSAAGLTPARPRQRAGFFTSPNVIALSFIIGGIDDDRRRACSTSEDHRTRDENHLASGRPRQARAQCVSGTRCFRGSGATIIGSLLARPRPLRGHDIFRSIWRFRPSAQPRWGDLAREAHPRPDHPSDPLRLLVVGTVTTASSRG